MMPRFIIFCVFVVVLFDGTLNSVQAQVTRAKETYTSLDGTLRFEYPAGWAVEENFDTGLITLATSQDSLERLGRKDLDADSRLRNAELATYIFLQAPNRDATLDTIRQTYEQAFPDFELRDTFLAGRPAMIARGETHPDEGTEQLAGDTIIVVVALDNEIGFVVGLARPGQLAPFETTIYEIAESLRIDRTAIKENVPLTSTFEPDDPTNLNWKQDRRDRVRQSEIADGLYRLTLNEAQTAMTTIVRSGSVYDDVQITMQVPVDEQALDTVRSYGILFRYVDATNFYIFEVHNHSGIGLGKYEQGRWTDLLDETILLSSKGIMPIDDAITVQVIAQGETITGLVNGEELVSLSDSSFQSGGVGIYFVSNVEGAVLSVDSHSVKAISD